MISIRILSARIHFCFKSQLSSSKRFIRMIDYTVWTTLLPLELIKIRVGWTRLDHMSRSVSDGLVNGVDCEILLSMGHRLWELAGVFQICTTVQCKAKVQCYSPMIFLDYFDSQSLTVKLWLLEQPNKTSVGPDFQF